jgi:putative membrane protein
MNAPGSQLHGGRLARMRVRRLPSSERKPGRAGTLLMTGGCVWLLVASVAAAQVSPQDQKWLQQAHQTNLAEIAAGKLAAHSGHAESVRDVGHTLALDHAAMDSKLVSLAKQFGVTLPKAPNAQQKADMHVFQHKHGMDFDKSWAHIEGDGHIQAIELTRFEMDNGSAAPVKQLAAQTLPVLKKHYHLLTHATTEIHGGP